MAQYCTVELDVEVNDPAGLWRAAAAYLKANGSDAAPELIGTEAAPHLGGCLQMLLDRSEFLDGAGEITESRTDWDADNLDDAPDIDEAQEWADFDPDC